MKKILFTAVTGLALLASTAVSATIIQSDTLLSGGSTLIDFESLSGNQGTSLTIGDVTFSRSSDMNIIDASIYTANGTEIEGNTLGGGSEAITLRFANGATEIGLGWFDVNFAGNYFEVYDIFDNLIESFEMTDLGPVGGSHAAFIGSIQSSTVIGSVVVNASEWFSIDNVSYSSVEVPEPGIVFLFCVGLLGLGFGISEKKRYVN